MLTKVTREQNVRRRFITLTLLGVLITAGSTLVGQCKQHEVSHTPVYWDAFQVAQLAHKYFNPSTDTSPISRTACDDLVTMIAIAGVESNGFDIQAQLENADCSQDYGLWQN